MFIKSMGLFIVNNLIAPFTNLKDIFNLELKAKKFH